MRQFTSFRMGLAGRLALGLALLLGGMGAAPAAPAATVPPGFGDSLVASVPLPTALAFTPDGRLLVTSQTGALRVYQAGSLAFSKIALDLGPIVCTEGERGLVGLTVDPQFASNHYT